MFRSELGSKTTIWRIIGLWLKDRALLFLFCALALLVFFIVYGLYNVDFGALYYAGLLAFVVGLAFAVVDIKRYAARYTALTQACESFPPQGLPRAFGEIEKAYQALVRRYDQDCRELHRQLDTFVSDSNDYYSLWAHQVKTPISAMRLILQQENRMDFKKTKDVLENELFRTEQYVAMVLQFQRMYNFNNDLDLRECRVESLVRKAVKNIAPLFIYKRLPVSIAKSENTIITDEKWFCFVLEQILTNAIKYTNRGEISAVCRENMLCIQDTGIGIPADELPRVFERGYTGTTGRSQSRATGIGLYLCKSILEKLGFGIAIQSEIGAGTTVIIDLNQLLLRPE